MTLDGRKIVVITKDDQGKRTSPRPRSPKAYQDDKADFAIGTTSSAAALAILPVAEVNKKILIVEPRLRTRLPARSGIAISSEPGAIRRRMRSRTQSRSASRASPWRHWRRTTPSAATASPPSRRRSPRPARRSPQKNMLRPRHRLHRGRPAPVRRAEGQARPQGDLGDLGRRRQSAGQAAGHGPKRLWHRAVDRRQHPAGVAAI